MRHSTLGIRLKHTGWKVGSVGLAMLLALALVTQTAAPRKAEASVGPNIASLAVELLVSVPTPLGLSSHDIEVMRDGHIEPAGSPATDRQYDTWDNNATNGPDFYGYRFATPQQISRVSFTEGIPFFDGGWFDDIRVETSSDGTTWTTVAGGVDANPPYPSGNDGISYNNYQWDFLPPITATYVRVIGTAGGAAGFTTVGELQVYGPGGVVPVDNIAPYADQVATNVANPSSPGSHDLEVLRDGIKPPPGSTNAAAQYDTAGSVQPSEVWFHYRWPARRTITRIEFYEGREAADGGWFSNLRIEMSSNGTDWATMKTAADAAPVYPNASDGTGFNRYTFNFATPRSGTHMRIIGPAGGSPGFASVSEIEVYAELEPGEGGYYPNIGPLANQILSSHPFGVGSGSPTLAVLNDGFAPGVNAVNELAQFDTWNGLNAATGPDWFGYRYNTTQLFTGLAYTEGMQFTDGGWFTSAPGVEVSLDGATWTPVATTIAPVYLPNDGQNFNRYVLTFAAPASGRYIRLIGTAGGQSEFTSIAELEVYGGTLLAANSVSLQLAQTVSNSTPNVGNTVTFTVTLSSNNGTTATGITVADTLPAGITLVSATPSLGAYTAGVWSVPSLPGNGSATLALAVTVDAGTQNQTITNTASISTTDQINTGAPTTAASSITVNALLGDPNIAPLADLLITSVPAPLGGGNHNIEIIRDLSYPAPGTNDPGAQYDTWDAGAPTPTVEYFGYRWPARYHFTGVKFVDGMHFGDGGYFAAAPRIEVSDDGVTWTTVATVTGYQGAAAPNFTAYPLTFTADGRYLRLAGTPAGAAEFTSIAELEVYGTVLTTAPNVNVTVNAVPNNPAVGGAVTVTVTAANTGDGAASGIVIGAAIPAGFTLVSATPSQGAYNAGVWTLGGLPAGGAETLVFVYTTDAGTGGQTITQTATITAMAEPNPGSGSGSASVTVQTPLGDPNIAPLADLLMTSVPAPLGGGNHNIEIIRDLSYPVPGTNDPGAQYDTFDFFAPTGPDYFGYRWSNRYHFTGVKFVDGMHFGDGGYFAAAPRIEVSDDGVTWTTVATVTGYQGSSAPNFTAYSIPFVADGRYLRLIGTPAGSADFTSIAELEVYGTALPGAPDVQLAVTVDNPTPQAGQTVTITITATNVGTAGATGVSVPWTLPAGLTLVSTTPSSGSPWAAGGLAVSEAKTLVIVATVTGPVGTPIVVSAGPVTCTEGCGSGPVSVTITPTATLAPVVNIAVAVDNPTPQVGQTVTITITATNVGSAGATGVSVPWTLPAGLTLVSTTPSSGSPWSVGSLAVSEAKTLVIVATVTGTPGQPLVVNVGPLTMDQANTGTGAGSVTITPAAAPPTDTCINTGGNLVVNGCFESNVVTHGWDAYKTGTLVGWTVQWLGDNPCLPSEPGYTGAQLELQRGILGPEYEGQQHAELDSDCNTSTNDTRNGEAGSVKIWQDIPTVAGNWYKIRYAYKSRPDTSSSTNGIKAYWGATNVATTGHATSWTVKEVVVQATDAITRVMFADNGTPDSLGSFIDDVRVTPTTAPVVNREVDLSWTASDTTPNVGQNVTFVLKAKNESSGSATGITIGVTIPAGLTVVSVTPNHGAYAAGVWNLGTLSGHTYKTLTVVAKPASGTAGQTLTVQGTITAMDQTNTGDGSASKSVTVNGGSSASAGWMNVGGNIGSGSHKYTWGGSISCDGIAKKSFEYKDHEHDIKFRLSTVTSVVCSTTPGVSHGQPRAGFNTLVLVGLSSDGQRVEATFIDAGEPGRNDTVNIKVFNAGGTQISSVSGRLDGGNLQAHKGGDDDHDDEDEDEDDDD